jgi:hypothetical protein
MNNPPIAEKGTDYTSIPSTLAKTSSSGVNSRPQKASHSAQIGEIWDRIGTRHPWYIEQPSYLPTHSRKRDGLRYNKQDNTEKYNDPHGSSYAPGEESDGPTDPITEEPYEDLSDRDHDDYRGKVYNSYSPYATTHRRSPENNFLERGYPSASTLERVRSRKRQQAKSNPKKRRHSSLLYKNRKGTFPPQQLGEGNDEYETETETETETDTESENIDDEDDDENDDKFIKPNDEDDEESENDIEEEYGQKRRHTYTRPSSYPFQRKNYHFDRTGKTRGITFHTLAQPGKKSWLKHKRKYDLPERRRSKKSKSPDTKYVMWIALASLVAMTILSLSVVFWTTRKCDSPTPPVTPIVPPHMYSFPPFSYQIPSANASVVPDNNNNNAGFRGGGYSVYPSTPY